ncbi:hypothetical protein HPB47_009593, partial [Ixodes persulcatus]
KIKMASETSSVAAAATEIVPYDPGTTELRESTGTCTRSFPGPCTTVRARSLGSSARPECGNAFPVPEERRESVILFCPFAVRFCPPPSRRYFPIDASFGTRCPCTRADDRPRT